MNWGLRHFLDREFHEEEEKHPLMALRNKSKFLIMFAAAPIVPISVLILILTLLTWNHSKNFDGDLWTAALVHPMTGFLSIAGALFLHRRAYY
ncbi:MAG: hypothetical protein R3261_13530, partial [Alphaproteobacteria bacterium]|nr:hypothetical protein [Alphaproteobacteria bacterium]